jgi:hypothetical protein
MCSVQTGTYSMASMTLCNAMGVCAELHRQPESFQGLLMQIVFEEIEKVIVGNWTGQGQSGLGS